MIISFIHWDLGKLTDWLLLGVSAFSALLSLCVLVVTIVSVRTLLRQLKSQTESQLFEAHKTLYMPIVENPTLAGFAYGTNAEGMRRKLLASMMINQAARIFGEFKNRVKSAHELAPIRRDMADLFSLDAIRDRWVEVRPYHAPAFVMFVERALEPTSSKHPEATKETGWVLVYVPVRRTWEVVGNETGRVLDSFATKTEAVAQNTLTRLAELGVEQLSILDRHGRLRQVLDLRSLAQPG